MTTIAYLGLGTMGTGMVNNLVKAGFDVTVWNRSPERAAKLLGVKVAQSIAGAIAGADFVLYCLSNDDAVRDVAFGAGGVLESVTPESIVVNMSTISAKLSDEESAAYTAKGIRFLDAPVFGSKDEVTAGGLWIVVGGDEAVFEATRPVFEALSETLHYMGPHGSGVRMKLVGNLMVAVEIEVLGEALTLAKKAGLDPHKVLEVAAVTDFKCPIFAGVGERVVTDDYSPAFSLTLMRKDAGLIQGLADSLDVKVPTAGIVKANLDRAYEAGLGGEHASAFIKLIADDADVNLSD